MNIFPRKLISKIKDLKFGLLLFLISFHLFAYLLLTFRITNVPPGINGDEAAIGYNAALVARTGHDQNGRFLPLFVSVFDLTDWKQPVTLYLTVLSFKIFGPSYFTLRAVSVSILLVSSFLILLLTKEILGTRAGLISLFIFITIPSVLIQSHLALENIAPIPFMTLWLLMLAKYQKGYGQKFLIYSGLFLGIGLFSYPGMRLIFPVLFFLTMGYIFYLNRMRSFKTKIPVVVKFSLVVLIFPTFMLLIKNQYPGAILAYNRPHDISSYQEAILPYISSFDPSFLFIQGDFTPYHSTSRQGVFLLATLPFFALGIFMIARKKNPILFFILLTFFLTPLLYGLASSVHRGSRLLVLLVPYTVITTFGAVTILNIGQRIKRLSILAILVSLIILNYIDFVRDYWYEYPKRVKSEFAKPYHLVFKKAYELAKVNNLTPYIQSDFRTQNQIAEDFFEQVYFPGKLKLWKDDQSIPEHSVIIVSDYILAKKSQVNQEKIDDFGFGLLINQTKNEVKQ